MPVPERTNGMSTGPTLKPLFLLRVFFLSCRLFFQEHLEFLNDEHLELSTMWLNTRKNYTQKRKEIKNQVC